jgi:hypothetical protein
MSPRQKQLIDERQSRAYGTYDAPFDHAGASAFLDMLSEEGLRLEEVMDRACFCGSQQTFGACHGIICATVGHPAKRKSASADWHMRTTAVAFHVQCDWQRRS